MKRKALWLIYRRLRIGLQASGFILLYGAYTNSLNLPLLLTALGFCFMDIFGALYNDYKDYELDVRNKRRDKWIVAGLLSRKNVLILSLVFMVLSFILLGFTNVLLFSLGFYYFLIYIAYSHPKIPMERTFLTYLLVGSVFLPMFYALSTLLGIAFTLIDVYYTLFVFFQCVYLLAHKDVNDTKDKINIFRGKYNRGFLICAATGALASAFLLLMSLGNIGLILMWTLNLIVLKVWLLRGLHKRTVKKKFRDWIVLFEFLTPFFYALVFIFGGLFV